MDFTDEHYVRLYTRDTKTWLRLGFEGQAILALLLRKLDKAGVLDDVDSPVEDVALVIGAPVEFVAVGLPRLLETGVFEHRSRCLVMPRYLDAQSATRSDAARARDHRRKRRDTALAASRGVTERHETSRAAPVSVTERHANDHFRDGASRNVTAPSQNVTERHENSVGRHSTQSNADQRREERSPPPPNRFDAAFRSTRSADREDVQRVHRERLRVFRLPPKTDLVRGYDTTDADAIAAGIDAHGEPAIVAMLRHAPSDGMVSGRADERGLKHESIRYLFGENLARLVRDAAEHQKPRGPGKASPAEIARRIAEE